MARPARPVLLGGLLAAALTFPLALVQLAGAPPPAGQMAEAADALLQSLTPEQRTKATFAFDAEERFDFHFIPRARKGLPLKEMTGAQREKAHALVQTGLSQRGYSAATTIIDLEKVLAVLENRPQMRDPELYFLTIFGTPGGAAPWGWRFEGHHLSINFTVDGDRSVAWAPSFFGANPAIVQEGPMKGTRPLRPEEEAARALMAALTEAQKKAAIFEAEAPRDIFTGANATAERQPNVGVAVKDMTPEQRPLLVALVDVYLDRMAPELASARRAQIQRAGLDNATFAWAGTTDVGAAHYYRVQGPTFLIEYDNMQNNANHIHSVWRDFAGDFGRDLLGEHYAEYRH